MNKNKNGSAPKIAVTGRHHRQESKQLHTENKPVNLFNEKIDEQALTLLGLFAFAVLVAGINYILMLSGGYKW